MMESDDYESRDMRNEAFVRGVGLWLMVAAVLVVVCWIPKPILNASRRNVDFWILWIGTLGLASVMLVAGRGLYLLSDLARVSMGWACAFFSFVTVLTIFIYLTSWKWEVNEVLFSLLGLNALVWGITGLRLVGAGARRVCAAQYSGRGRAGLIPSQASFWILVVAHGSLLAWITCYLWR